MPKSLSVTELRQQFAQFPYDMPVMTLGYETGLDAVIAVEPTSLVRFRNAHAWDGRLHPTAKFPPTLSLVNPCAF